MSGDGRAGGEPVLRVAGGGVHLGGRWIWRDVNLEVAPGDFVAVLGPNAAGKSTLLKAVLGLLPLSAGTIEVLGAPARRGNSLIGYLPQRRTFEPDLRVRGRDVVRLGLDGARWGVPVGGLLRGERAAVARRRVDEVIELVGASAYADRPAGELSGGEQQRLLIAQALVSRPRLLLLDEPLDSLDLSNQRQVAALVHRISLEQGVAVMLVAHDVNPILAHLDHLVYVAAGRAVIGTPAEVVTTATLSALYGVPVEVLTTRDGRVIVVGQPGEDQPHYHAAH